MSRQQVLAFVDEAARIAADGMPASQLRRELERMFAEQARASLHAGAHLALAVEALPPSPAVSRTRTSLGALQAQLNRWDCGLQYWRRDT
jgi:hypothetical protein